MAARQRQPLIQEQPRLSAPAPGPAASPPSIWDLPAAVVGGIVAFRVINALVLRTFFVPDEYYQGVEVAHRMVFGYGHLTWEWEHHLRGALHPAIYAAIFYALKVLRLDTPEAVIYMPLILHGMLTALADLHVYVLARRLFGARAGVGALICSLSSWFIFYCGPRTLSNTLEAILTPIALAYLPLRVESTSRAALTLPLALAALACLLRPPAAVLWLCVFGLYLARLWASPQGKGQALRVLVAQFLPVAVAAAAISLGVDYAFYGRMEIVQLNFLRFNLIQDAGRFYGTHPWHWYFTQGFPVVCGPLLPLVIAGAACEKAARKHTWLLVCALATLAVLSIPGHKEFRFGFSLLYVALPFCGLALAGTPAEKNGASVGGDDDDARKKEKKRRSSSSSSSSSPLSPGSVWHMLSQHWKPLLLALNIPLALYTGVVHKGAPLEVMGYLRGEIEGRGAGGSSHDSLGIALLMPCHATPMHSHLHASGVRVVFPLCPPPGVGVDETAAAMSDPVAWLSRQEQVAGGGPRGGLWLSHVVIFDTLLARMQPWLADNGFQQQASFFFAHVYEGWEGERMLVYKRM